MIDAHCHIHQSSQLPTLISSAQSAGVQQVLLNATCEQDWAAVLSLHQAYSDFVVPCLGVHPWFCRDLGTGWELRLGEILREQQHVLLGEVGLDHYSSKYILSRRPPKPLQAQVCFAQLSLAEQLQRPISIHCVRAHKPLLKLMQQLPNKPPILMHSWSGNPIQVTQFLHAFPQSLFFSVSQASLTESAESVAAIPLDRIVVETDSPYLCKPEVLADYGIVPERDEHNSPINEPKYLPCSTRRLASLLQRSEEEVRTATAANIRRFLGT